MSAQHVPVQTPRAASQHDPDETAQHTSTAAYRAPYHQYEESRVPGIYIVVFRSGHTVTKHFAFLGRTFDTTAFEDDVGYGADMDDRQLEAVRRDPGVEWVEDNVSGKRL